MTYVIAEPCVDVKDLTCVDECPVDCIYEGERMLYIHPDECVDCGACEPVCPVEAIFYEDDVPEQWKMFTEDNARFFSDTLPGRDEPIGSPARYLARSRANRHATGGQPAATGAGGVTTVSGRADWGAADSRATAEAIYRSPAPLGASEIAGQAGQSPQHRPFPPRRADGRRRDRADGRGALRPRPPACCVPGASRDGPRRGSGGTACWLRSCSAASAGQLRAAPPPTPGAPGVSR